MPRAPYDRNGRPLPPRPGPLGAARDFAEERPLAAAGIAAGLALAAAALVNRRFDRRAEAEHPPEGRFLDVGGARLHLLDEGEGEPVVLLHGNGSMASDFASSGVVGALVKRGHRVIAFDRPGYGHSERPRLALWTHEAQADLIAAAMAQLGLARAVVLGHSWGCSVAVALALRHPGQVRALVLASGYYYPSARADVVLASGPAVPVLGDLLRYTLSPLIARLSWGALTAKLFAPEPVTASFPRGVPRDLALRPLPLRASAEEAALMIPDAAVARHDYARLTLPVAILAGDEDRLIDPDAQSARLHAALPQSTFHRLPGAGHMIEQTRPGALVDAVGEMILTNKKSKRY